MKLKAKSEKCKIKVQSLKFFSFKFWFCVFSFTLLVSSVVAQAPSLNLPEMPKQNLTVIFKDITKHDQFNLVIQALKQSKRVDPFVMTRAHRGYIEYEGKFFGESESLLETIQMSAEGGLKIDSKPKGKDGLEIVITAERP